MIKLIAKLTPKGSSLRAPLIIIALVASLLVLGYELLTLLPHAPEFAPTDYQALRQWGLDAQRGEFNYLYPLPALLFIFLPLSLLPWWTVYIWVVIPFIFVLFLHREKGIALFLFVPMLAQAAWGTLDGFFILPLYWLFNNQSLAAGISAALLTLKPQLGIFTVPIVLLQSIKLRRWKLLIAFSSIMLLLYLPSFLIDPLWPIKMIPFLQWRTDVWFLHVRAATLWGWWWRGDWALVLLPIPIVATILFFIRAWRAGHSRLQALHLLGLLVQPVFFVVSLGTIIATLKTSLRDFAFLVTVSWLALGLDNILAWGGVYVIISLAALWLLGNKKSSPCSLETQASDRSRHHTGT